MIAVQHGHEPVVEQVGRLAGLHATPHGHEKRHS